MPGYKGPGFEDGHYHMMDWGEFVVKDKLAYFPDGDVVDTTVNVPWRWYPEDPRIEACPEDYSAWNDDRRCLEQAIAQAERELVKAEVHAEDLAQWRLALSARRKCTRDEFWAVVAMGRGR
ncbi:MAG: hypothetical protein FGM15_12670 [Chthoniobacterales bacterium]|nr:hypothetical protein [Chthoniobacterales bacterium]